MKCYSFACWNRLPAANIFWGSRYDLTASNDPLPTADTVSVYHFCLILPTKICNIPRIMNSNIKFLNISSIKSANHWIVSFATIYLLLALNFLIIRYTRILLHLSSAKILLLLKVKVKIYFYKNSGRWLLKNVWDFILIPSFQTWNFNQFRNTVVKRIIYKIPVHNWASSLTSQAPYYYNYGSSANARFCLVLPKMPFMGWSGL